MRYHLLAAVLLALPSSVVKAAPGDKVWETCPDTEDVGDNVECYPLTFISKTEVHPDGIPIIAYLFVPKNRPDEPLPAIVFAHGSGSMYSLGHHNDGLNSKHEQWVRQFTNELGYVSLHVSSFHSRYLLPDTDGDQRIMQIDAIPAEHIGRVGGDDYRATSFMGSRNNATRVDVVFDPDPPDDKDVSPDVRWKDSNNKGAGVSEVMERAYDMDAAWDFLAGIREGTMIPVERRRNDRDSRPTLGVPAGENGHISEIVAGLAIDHKRIFLHGTSHGGQTAMATAHTPRILSPGNPMNADLPEGYSPYRYAAFFDYYGGCNLYGAYGGSGANSLWRPYAPFIKLAGEYDETVFDALPVDSREKFGDENCGKRFAAAFADPNFTTPLAAVIYDDAYHSFDGVARDDFIDEHDTGEEKFSDWAAKIHANYAITVPFMEAIQRQAFGESRSLDELGFDRALEAFNAIPYTPVMPPMIIRSAFGPPTRFAMARNDGLDLSTTIVDPLQVFDISWSTIGSDYASVKDGVLSLAIPNDVELPVRFIVAAETSQGLSFFPARYESGVLTFEQGFHARSANRPLSSVGNELDLLELVKPMTGFGEYGIPHIAINGALPKGVTLNGYRLHLENGTTLPEALSIELSLPHVMIAAELNRSGDGMTLTKVEAFPKAATEPEDPHHPGNPGENDDDDEDGHPDDPEAPNDGHGKKGGGGGLLWLLSLLALMPRRQQDQ